MRSEVDSSIKIFDLKKSVYILLADTFPFKDQGKWCPGRGHKGKVQCGVVATMRAHNVVPRPLREQCGAQAIKRAHNVVPRPLREHTM